MHNVRIDLQENRVTITPHPSKEFSLTSIPERIKEAGFEPDDMNIVARGTVNKSDSHSVFRIENWQHTYILEMNDPPEETLKLRAQFRFDRDPPVLVEKQ